MNPSVYAAMEYHDQSSWYYRGKRAAIRALIASYAHEHPEAAGEPGVLGLGQALQKLYPCA